MAVGNRSLEFFPDGKPRFRGCSKVADYKYLGRLGEGTFGEVSKAQSKGGQIVALKKILVHNEKDGFPITAMREIKLLKSLDHPNILKLVEMAIERPKDVTKKSSFFMVTPYMDHDLSGILKNENIVLRENQIKCYMQQLLVGCKYLHDSKILHRDMKAANLLINNRGILQIADFGLARAYDDAPPVKGSGGGTGSRPYTALVVTRWYRPPELLLQLKNYTTAVDMWGVGCIFGEMYNRKPILQGDSDLAQTQMIFKLVGSPDGQNMPGWDDLPGCEGIRQWDYQQPRLRQQFGSRMTPSGLALLEGMLKLDWRARITAVDALDHPYFKTDPLPARPEDLPHMEESHELDSQKRKENHKPPPAPAGGQVGVARQAEDGFQDNSRPYNRRNDRGGRPLVNGRGRGAPRNGGPGSPRRDYDQRGPPREYDERPRYYDDYDRERDRRPLLPRHQDDRHGSYSRGRILPDTTLPARPPPPVEMIPMNHTPERRDNYRDERRDAPSRIPLADPIPNGTNPRIPPQSHNRGADVDTYIPSYSTADPNSRPPPRRDRGPPPHRIPRDDPYGQQRDDRPYRDDRRPIHYGPADYDEPPPYDERTSYTNGGSTEGYPASQSQSLSQGQTQPTQNGDPYAYRNSRGPSSIGSFNERRRSRSPNFRDRMSDRERERDLFYDRDRDRDRGAPPQRVPQHHHDDRRGPPPSRRDDPYGR